MDHSGHLKDKFTASTFAEKTEDDVEFPCPAGGASLTSGEAAFVKSIFGDEVDTARIKKYYSPKEKPGTEKGFVIPAETFGDDSIKFYGPNYYEADYSKARNIFDFGTFIHEMTHIWQNQNKIACKLLPENTDIYNYTLKPLSTFDDFGWEQQAKIIENYSRLYLYPNPTEVADPLLQKVVEAKFPQAAKARLKLQMKKNSPSANTNASPKHNGPQ
jgi:hypothetical protein